jgi:hypothetical protein
MFFVKFAEFQQPCFCFVMKRINNDGRQFHQYQQNEQLPLNSDGQQYHQYQQNEQSPLILTH